MYDFSPTFSIQPTFTPSFNPTADPVINNNFAITPGASSFDNFNTDLSFGLGTPVDSFGTTTTGGFDTGFPGTNDTFALDTNMLGSSSIFDTSATRDRSVSSFGTAHSDAMVVDWGLSDFNFTPSTPLSFDPILPVDSGPDNIFADTHSYDDGPINVLNDLAATGTTPIFSVNDVSVGIPTLVDRFADTHSYDDGPINVLNDLAATGTTPIFSVNDGPVGIPTLVDIFADTHGYDDGPINVLNDLAATGTTPIFSVNDVSVGIPTLVDTTLDATLVDTSFEDTTSDHSYDDDWLVYGNKSDQDIQDKGIGTGFFSSGFLLGFNKVADVIRSAFGGKEDEPKNDFQDSQDRLKDFGERGVTPGLDDVGNDVTGYDDAPIKVLNDIAEGTKTTNAVGNPADVLIGVGVATGGTIPIVTTEDGLTVLGSSILDRLNTQHGAKTETPRLSGLANLVRLAAKRFSPIGAFSSVFFAQNNPESVEKNISENVRIVHDGATQPQVQMRNEDGDWWSIPVQIQTTADGFAIDTKELKAQTGLGIEDLFGQEAFPIVDDELPNSTAGEIPVDPGGPIVSTPIDGDDLPISTGSPIPSDPTDNVISTPIPVDTDFDIVTNNITDDGKLITPGQNVINNHGKKGNGLDYITGKGHTPEQIDEIIANPNTDISGTQRGKGDLKGQEIQILFGQDGHWVKLNDIGEVFAISNRNLPLRDPENDAGPVD